MTKEIFVKMIVVAEKFDAELERWNDFGIELYELPIGELPWQIFDAWVDTNFNSNGKDWITWYFWERKSIFTGEVLPCYDENDNEFYVNTPDDLWELVERHQLDYFVEETCDTKSDIS